METSRLSRQVRPILRRMKYGICPVVVHAPDIHQIRSVQHGPVESLEDGPMTFRYDVEPWNRETSGGHTDLQSRHMTVMEFQVTGNSTVFFNCLPRQAYITEHILWSYARGFPSYTFHDLPGSVLITIIFISPDAKFQLFWKAT